MFLPMSNIRDPRDPDVLCGRGGSSLKHPGNQTYRRLVNSNKGLYTTCLKTEKLKISRSIVATIRGQNGRFLERDGNRGTWYDIGDKKAIEKTSQALREGQPKLRQKIIELGGSEEAISLEEHFTAYKAQNMQSAAIAANAVYGRTAPFADAHAMQQLSQQHIPQNLMAAAAVQQAALVQRQAVLQHQQQQIMAAQAAAQEMAVPRTVAPHRHSQDALETKGNEQYGQQQVQMSEIMLNQLSLQSHPPAAAVRQSGIEPTTRCGGIHESLPEVQSSLYRNGSLGANRHENRINSGPAASDQHRSESQPEQHQPVQHHRFEESSSFDQPPGKNHLLRESNIQIQRIQHQQAIAPAPLPLPPQESHRKEAPLPLPILVTTMNSTEESKDPYAGRKEEAPMDPSSRSTSTPQAETSPPTLSATSSTTMNPPAQQPLIRLDRRRLFAKMKVSRLPPPPAPSEPSPVVDTPAADPDDMPDIHMVESTNSVLSNMSGVSRDALSRSSNDHKMRDIDNLTCGSRGSFMSGLSLKTGESSEVQSIFSDLSHKIGNVSTRSLAMSEISGIEEPERENLEESFQINLSPAHFDGERE